MPFVPQRNRLSYIDNPDALVAVFLVASTLLQDQQPDRWQQA